MPRYNLGLTVLLALALGGCAVSGPSPDAETGPDPTVVDADHYRVEFENDRVRVLRIQYAPGEKSVMHYHPNNFGVFLVDQKARFTLPDGSSVEIEGKAGTTGWGAGGQHLPENLTENPIELILIEMKSPADTGASKDVAPGSDPTIEDADHYAVEFENNQIRALRIQYDPGEKSVLHYHPAGVAVFLTDQKVSFEMPDGSSVESAAKAGEAVWVDAGSHIPKNIADEALELILVEMK